MISHDLKKRLITSLALLLSSIFIIKFNSILLLSLIIIGIFSFIEFTQLIKKIFKNDLNKFFLNILFVFFIFSFFNLFFIFSNFFHFKIVLFSLVFCCVASDLGGFIFGKLFKGPKLTKISPNKTIIGAIGSVLFASFTLSSIFFIILSKFNFKILVIGFITSIFCQLGDLFFSYLKRKAKVKDTGNYLPGHGGFLDRIDGMLLGIPAGFMMFIIIFS